MPFGEAIAIPIQKSPVRNRFSNPLGSKTSQVLARTRWSSSSMSGHGFPPEAVLSIHIDGSA